MPLGPLPRAVTGRKFCDPPSTSYGLHTMLPSGDLHGMTPHSSLKRRIIAALREQGCVVTSYDGSTAGVLDLFICTPTGGYVELDIKVGRDKLSKLQKNRIMTITAARGNAAEVRSVAEALAAALL